MTVEADVPGEDPALLVLSDQHAPGWSAEIDGAPSEILRANCLVRGVWVPAGRHAITFSYRTPGLREGWLLAAALAATLAAWARWRRRPLPSISKLLTNPRGGAVEYLPLPRREPGERGRSPRGKSAARGGRGFFSATA